MKPSELIEKLEHLPPDPSILVNVSNLLEDENCTSEQLSNVIKLDPSLSAKILSLSNTAAMASPSPICDLEEAINFLGFSQISKMLGALFAQNMAEGDLSLYALNKNELWLNSMAVAIAMEAMAKNLNKSQSIAYNIGLFHSLGKIVYNEVAQEEYKKVFQLVEEKNYSHPLAEKDVFGFNKAQLGAELLRHWKIHESIVTPVEHQYEPSQAKEHEDLCAMLHLALWVAAAMGNNHGRDAWAMEFDTNALHTLKVDASFIELLAIDTRQGLNELQQKISSTGNN